MKSIFAKAIDSVVDKVLQSEKGKASIKIENSPTEIVGKWETTENGDTVIGIYVYVNNALVFTMQDMGTKVLLG